MYGSRLLSKIGYINQDERIFEGAEAPVLL